MFNVDKYGVQIKGDNYNVKLRDENVIKLLIALKHNKDWVAILERVATANKETAVGRGACSFPISCNDWYKCNTRNCDADVCSNGYAYRMS